MAVTKEFLNQAYLAYFGRPIDPNGALFYAQPGMTQAQVEQDFFNSAESQALYGTVFDVAQVNKIYNVLFGRDGDVAGVTWWANQIVNGLVSPAAAAIAILNGAQGSDKVIVENKLVASAAFTTGLDTLPEIVGYSGDAANAVAKAFLASVTTTPATPAEINAAIAAAVAVGGASGGETFSLTTAVDVLTGTPNNDIFIGTLGDNVNTTYNTGDTLNGSGGIDTLRLVASDDSFESNIVFLNSVERIDVLNAAWTRLDLNASNWHGVTTYAVNNGNATTEVDNISEAFTTVGFTNFGTGDSADDNLELYVANDVFTGTDDTVTVNLNKAGSNVDGDYADLYIYNNNYDNVVEKLVVNSATASAGDENYLYYNNASDALKTITVTGTAGVAFELDSYNKLESIDASAATGTVDFWTQDTIYVEKAFTYTGSQGKDKVAIEDDSSSGVAIAVNTGTGNDIVELTAAPQTNTKYAINLGAGDDALLGTSTSYAPGATSTIDGGDGKDTLGVALVNVGNSTDFKNFEILDAAGINTSVAFDAAIMTGSTFTGVAVTDWLGANATVNGTGFADGLTVTGDPGYWNLTLGFAGTSGTADALNITFNDAEKGSANSLGFGTLKINGIETFNITSSGSDSGDYNEIVTLSSNTVSTINVTGANDFGLDGITNVTAAGVTSFAKLDASTSTGDNWYYINDLVSQQTAATKVNVAYSALLGSGDDYIWAQSLAANTKTTTANIDVSKGGNDYIDLDSFFASTASVATATTGSIVNITGANAGDVINVTSVASAATLGAAQNVGAATNVAEAAQLALIGAAANNVAWFALGGNTYVAVDVDNNDTYTSADTLVKLVGTYDLSHATYSGGDITLV